MGKTVLGSAYQPATTQLSGRELAKAVSNQAADQTYKIALERKWANRELSTSQKAALTKMAELEALTDAEARRERPPLPGRYPTEQRYTPASIIELGKLPFAEAAHRAREMRAAMRNDPKSAYNNPQDPAHKQAVHEMNLLYGAERYEDGTPVLPDEPKKNGH